MSVEEIVRYVRQTPGNTNPSVVGSMVNAEMNSTLKAAKEYTDSQRLAYTEKKVLTYDGNPDKIFPYNDRMYIVYASDEHIDLNSIKSAVVVPENSEPFTFVITEETAQIDTIDGFPCLYVHFGGVTAPAVVLIPNEYAEAFGAKGGTYLFGYTNEVMTGYISRIEYDVTVHQIDKKFIPNTVINLCDYGINVYELLASGKTSGSFTIENTKEFWDKIPTDYSSVTLVNDDGVNDVIATTPVVTYKPDKSSAAALAVHTKLLTGSMAIGVWLFLDHTDYLNEDGTIYKTNTNIWYEFTITAAPT